MMKCVSDRAAQTDDTLRGLLEDCYESAVAAGYDGDYGSWVPTADDLRWMTEQLGYKPTREAWRRAGLGWVGGEHCADVRQSAGTGRPGNDQPAAAEAEGKMEKKKRLVVQWSRLPRINSGALVQPKVTETTREIRLSAEVVAVSAAGHVAPAYPRAAEAPRVYGPTTRRTIREAWLLWFAARLGGDGAQYVAHAQIADGDWAGARDTVVGWVRR